MKRCLIILCFLSAFVLFCSWGFFPHKLINQHAIYTLPPDLSYFYKKHEYSIKEFAVNADKRVYIDPAESPRHFIDLDRFENTDSLEIPWFKVKKRYDEQFVLSRGIVPWHIEATYKKLVNAFYKKDIPRIIKLSADLGHYTADAHVPLHTTSNYNGQFTNQTGIHALWETRLPEKFFKGYKLYVGKAEYVEDVLKFAWETVKESHALLDSVLGIEKQLSQETAILLHRSYIIRGQQIQTNYSDFYINSYHNRLNNMVKRRMKKSIYAIGSLWFSAWVDAGQPNLNSKFIPVETDSMVIQRDSKFFGREEWH